MVQIEPVRIESICIKSVSSKIKLLLYHIVTCSYRYCLPQRDMQSFTATCSESYMVRAQRSFGTDQCETKGRDDSRFGHISNLNKRK